MKCHELHLKHLNYNITLKARDNLMARAAILHLYACDLLVLAALQFFMTIVSTSKYINNLDNFAIQAALQKQI